MKCFIFNQVCPNVVEENGPVFVISPFGFPFNDQFSRAIAPTIQKIKEENINDKSWDLRDEDGETTS